MNEAFFFHKFAKDAFGDTAVCLLKKLSKKRNKKGGGGIEQEIYISKNPTMIKNTKTNILTFPLQKGLNLEYLINQLKPAEII